MNQPEEILQVHILQVHRDRLAGILWGSRCGRGADTCFLLLKRKIRRWLRSRSASAAQPAAIRTGGRSFATVVAASTARVLAGLAAAAGVDAASCFLSGRADGASCFL